MLFLLFAIVIYITLEATFCFEYVIYQSGSNILLLSCFNTSMHQFNRSHLIFKHYSDVDSLLHL